MFGLMPGIDGMPRTVRLVPPFASNQAKTWRMTSSVGVSGPFGSRLNVGPR
jgi:hypothetical protein